jgi:HlyD family secretion protein
VKTKWKVILTLVAVVVAAAGVWASTVYSKRGVITVQTGVVVRQDLVSHVTASGEIKPKNYINIGANAMGDITELLVKEGDRVRKDQLLARIENTQPAADVANRKKPTWLPPQADSAAAEAGLKAADDNIATMQAAVAETQADLSRMKHDSDRAEQLYNEKLGAKQDFDSKKSLYEAQKSAVAQAQARVIQARTQREQTAAQLTSYAAAHRRGARQPGAQQRCPPQVRFLRSAGRGGHQPAGARR